MDIGYYIKQNPLYGTFELWYFDDECHTALDYGTFREIMTVDISNYRECPISDTKPMTGDLILHQSPVTGINLYEVIDETDKDSLNVRHIEGSAVLSFESISVDELKILDMTLYRKPSVIEIEDPSRVLRTLAKVVKMSKGHPEPVRSYSAGESLEYMNRLVELGFLETYWIIPPAYHGYTYYRITLVGSEWFEANDGYIELGKL